MRASHLILALTAIALPAAAAPGPQCDYFDLTRNIAIAGDHCSLSSTKTNGHFVRILQLSKGEKVTVEYVKDQNGNHIWNINGKPGWGYEIDQTHMHGATNDLNQIIDWTEPD